MYKLKIEYTLYLNSPFHSKGDRLSLEVDNPLTIVKKGEVEYILIPGSHIKGILRNSGEIILKSNGIKVCASSKAEEMCENCIICESFGSRRNRGKLFFKNILIDEYIANKKIGVSIERKTKKSKEKHLFSTEIAHLYKKVKGKITGFFENKKQAELTAIIIYLASKNLNFIGSEKSRGLGWIKLEDLNFSINGQSFKIGETPILQTLNSLKEGVKNE